MQRNPVKETKRYPTKRYMAETECSYPHVSTAAHLSKVQLIAYWYGGGDSVPETKFAPPCVPCMIKATPTM